jgi:hypothetical protein
MGTLRVGDPLDKNTDVGAINSKQQLEKIQELVAAGEEEGRRDLPAAMPPAGEGVVVRADRLHQRRAELPDRAGGDLRPVLSVLTFRTPDEAVEKANNTPYGSVGRRVDGEGLADPVDGAAPARRGHLGEHVQPLRPGLALRRLQGVRLRPGRRPAWLDPYLRFE